MRRRNKAVVWACSWELRLDRPHASPEIYGEDALDAFFNWLIVVEQILKAIQKGGMEVWWLTRGDNAGLPNVKVGPATDNEKEKENGRSDN